MAYKDKKKQKQASREAMRRHRARKQGITQDEGDVIPEQDVIPSNVIPNYGQPDCQCQHCQSNRANGNRHIINHGVWKPASELGRNELNRVSLPGDADYVGVQGN